jgi:hypothetical protein
MATRRSKRLREKEDAEGFSAYVLSVEAPLDEKVKRKPKKRAKKKANIEAPVEDETPVIGVRKFHFISDTR